MSTPNSKTHAELCAAINEAGQRIGNRTTLLTAAIAEHIGLSATEFECLDVLREAGPVPAGHLAELTGLTTGAITGVVDRLERAGFAHRTHDPADRRRVIIEARPGQLETITKLYEPLGQAYSQILKNYDPQQLAVILQFLHDAIHVTEQYAAQLRQVGEARDQAPAS